LRKNPRKKAPSSLNEKNEPELIRLNRYIANSGICSRREADTLITEGRIKVNGEIVTQLGLKVGRKDKVTYKGKILSREKLVYVLLNKPKDFITTTKDPEGRRTVMELVSRATSERIFPVGRLDRNTTGLLLFTNDGDLAKRLSHPSHTVQKIYRITLNKPVTQRDLQSLADGVELEDGIVSIDDMAVLNKEKTEVGLEIHSGRNRVVRRLFEYLGYEVKKLDRTSFAGLSKKDLSRGRWRYLTEMEVRKLKRLTGIDN